MLLFLVPSPGPAFSEVPIQLMLSWEHQDQLSTQRPVPVSHGQEHSKLGCSSASRDVVLLPYKTHLSLWNMTFTHIMCFCSLIHTFSSELSSPVFSMPLLLIIPANDNLSQRLLPPSWLRDLRRSLSLGSGMTFGAVATFEHNGISF